MKFTAVAVLASLAAYVNAAAFTNTAFNVQAGKPFTLTWDNANGPVTIALANGPNSNLKIVMTLDTNDNGQSFTWTPPASLPTDTYAFVITDNDGPNYSVQFPFQGSASATLSATSASSSTTGSSTTRSSTASTTLSTSVTSTTSKASSTTSGSSSTTSSSSSSSASSSSTSSTSSKSTSTTSSTSSSQTAKPTNTNDSPKGKSPLAFVLVTVATLVYFN